MVQNAGQTCSAGSRVLVEKSAYDEVVGVLAEKILGAYRLARPRWVGNSGR